MERDRSSRQGGQSLTSFLFDGNVYLPPGSRTTQPKSQPVLRTRRLETEHRMPTIQDARTKIRQVFRFLAAFQKIRTPPVRQLSEYDWHLFLNDLPKDPSIEVGQFIAGAATPTDVGTRAIPGFILQVRRPKETACPSPPDVLRDWVAAGWQNIDGEINTVSARNFNVDGNTVTQGFDDNPARKRALEAWRDKRKDWIKAERPVREAMKVFRKLFELRGRLEREAERFQLVLADGLLKVADAQGIIDHPLLLQKVELQFDAAIPAFTIVETVDAPELHTGLLGSIPGVEGTRIGAFLKDLEQQPYHPLRSQDTQGFLSRLVQSLFDNGRFEPAGNASPKYDTPVVYRNPVLD